VQRDCESERARERACSSTPTTHHATARTVIAEALDQADRLALAASTLVENPVGPARRGNDAVDLVRDLRQRFAASSLALPKDRSARRHRRA